MKEDLAKKLSEDKELEKMVQDAFKNHPRVIKENLERKAYIKPVKVRDLKSQRRNRAGIGRRGDSLYNAVRVWAFNPRLQRAITLEVFKTKRDLVNRIKELSN